MLYPTYRHFGPADPTPLPYLRQAGGRGIVTALHHVPVGKVWAPEAIRQRCAEVAAAGLEWTVVESLPVSEAIKTRTGDYERHLDNYVTSLANLGAAGVRTVTYNFMPVMDWTRTDLDYRMPDGGAALRFDRALMTAFDLLVLRRPAARAEYSQREQAAARDRWEALDAAGRDLVVANVTKGLPGSEESFTMEQFRTALAAYDDIDADRLREHLVAFLAQVTPAAEAAGVRLVVHPDDPPFPLLGLPRIVSTADDFQRLIDAVPSPANGLCFCTGSFGVRPDNDLPAMAARFADRIHFVHLRSTRREADGSFHEAGHLTGDVDMVAVLRALLAENARRTTPIPFRPDHGHCILDDLAKPAGITPGYTAIGRLKGMAELIGVQTAILAE